MSFTNVLPSAPSYNEAQPLYPTHDISQINAEDFRLKKISDLLKELSDEAEHYRHVAKKCKRTHSIVHKAAVALRWAVIWCTGHRLDRVRCCCKPHACLLLLRFAGLAQLALLPQARGWNVK